MPIISPLSSPQLDHVDQLEVPISQTQARIPRRLTQDLETEGLLPIVTASKTPLHRGWSFLDLYNDVFGLDQYDVPFDEDGDALPLPSSISQNCSSSDSFNSSPRTGSDSSEDTRILHSNLLTPASKESREVLGETMDLGNCTYDHLNSTVTKKNTTLTKSNLSHSIYTCNVSSTPLNAKIGVSNLASNLITSDPITPGFSRKSILGRSMSLDPITPPALSFTNIGNQQEKHQTQLSTNQSDPTPPLELAIKPADSTVDIDSEPALDDVQVNPDKPLVLMKPRPPIQKQNNLIIPKRKSLNIIRAQKSSIPAPRQKQPLKSTLPTMANRPPQKGGSGPRSLQGMRPASSTSTLPQPRSSLLPTSMKSRSQERINTAVNSTTTSKHKK